MKNLSLKFFLFICSYIFCWIRILTNNSGSNRIRNHNTGVINKFCSDAGTSSVRSPRLMCTTWPAAMTRPDSPSTFSPGSSSLQTQTKGTVSPVPYAAASQQTPTSCLKGQSVQFLMLPPVSRLLRVAKRDSLPSFVCCSGPSTSCRKGQFSVCGPS